jgi:hypothetical protein
MAGKAESITGGIVTGLRSRGLLLPTLDFEGSLQLPRALFAGEVLARDGCVVASALAERDGDGLTLEEISDVGRLRQASVDEDGLREALLRHDDASPVLIAKRAARFEVSVAASDPGRAGELAEELAGRLRVEREASDTRVPVAFWSGSGQGFPGAPEARWRRLHLPRFATIEDNYRSQIRDQLAELFAWPSGDGMPGRLALWHGPPGTGKTWALRALGREWNGWCDLHYVTDPERLLGGDTGYMLSVLASRSEPVRAASSRRSDRLARQARDRPQSRFAEDPRRAARDRRGRTAQPRRGRTSATVGVLIADVASWVSVMASTGTGFRESAPQTRGRHWRRSRAHRGGSAPAW